jgi:ATP-dependent DNA ligase
LHPAASRVDQLARESYVAFDPLARDGEDLRERPLADRRTALERVLADAPATVWPTPATDDPRVAGEWLGGGVDGADGVARRRRWLSLRQALPSDLG